MLDTLEWIDAGRQFTADDMVFWQGRGREPLAAALPHIDTIVLGPHASAAFPAELRPFVAPALTRRKQFDYSDVLTSTLGRAWAQADPHVVFVENPHSRLVLDGNREAPADVGPGLREFFARLARQRHGEKVSFGGVDAVRPITFAGEVVLQEPASEAQWAQLVEALATAGALGARPYFAARQAVIDAVLAARKPGAALRVVSLHDTMNTKIRADGAIVVERPEADRLPAWVNFGNRGDVQGEEDGLPLTLAAAEMRRIRTAWADAFAVEFGSTGVMGASAGDGGFSLNEPYKGAFETVFFGAQLQTLAEPCVGAVQVEFLRESLLGPAVTAGLQRPGTDWPAPDAAHLARVVASLCAAGRQLRA